MNDFVKCEDCKCLINKQCRMAIPVCDHRGYAVWPEIKYADGGCFNGISDEVKLSDMVLNEQIKENDNV